MTPERRTELYIEDIIEHAQYALEFTKDATKDDLVDDTKLRFAVVRALEIVGEAARAIPDDVRKLAPEVPWRDIVTTRNKIVHHYFGVKLHVVWNVVQKELAPLIESMKRLRVQLAVNDDKIDDEPIIER